MNWDEYKKEGFELYERLALVVHELIKCALEKKQGYRLQQIQHRAKSLESLKGRLEEAEALGTGNIERLRKDLAGCRLIFYTNNDVNRLTTSGLLHELFEVDLDRSKFHQPKPGDKTAESLFQSCNYVVSLKSDRTDLLEYADFKDRWCEVQVQTSLNHTWAEMEHDIIYKHPDLAGFGEREMKMIKQRLEVVMRKYLLPAGFFFQRIDTDIQRLMDSKAFFDQGAMDAVIDATDNNLRQEAVHRLRDDILPYYDDLASKYPEIREKLKRAWLIAEETETKPHETPFGNFAGAEPHTVTSAIADIFRRYRYLDVHATYVLICYLFRRTKSEEPRSQLIELAERLSAYTLQIWQEYGPLAQVMLAKALEKEEDLASITPIAAAIAGEILGLDVRGTTSTSNVVTFHADVVIFSDALAKARRQAIDTLVKIASETDNDDTLRLQLSKLFLASRTPQHNGATDQIMEMILGDAAHMLAEIRPVLTKADLSVRQNMEDELLSVWHCYRSLPDDLAKIPAVASAQAQLINRIIEVRDALNADEAYVTFKTIVGFRPVFPHMWEDDQMDFERSQAERDARQDVLAEAITPATWRIWKPQLIEAAQVKSNDLATFPPYKRFIGLLAASQPELALDLLRERDAMPRWTVHLIANALLDGVKGDETKGILEAWIETDEYLPEIAAIVSSAEAANLALVTRVVERATSLPDVCACTTLIANASRKFEQDEVFWRDAVFFPCLEVLANAESYAWTGWRTQTETGDKSLYGSLSEAQCKTVLDAMVGLPSVDYWADYILRTIAKRFHRLVLDWFGERIRRAREGTTGNYTAIPSSFRELQGVLSHHPKDIIDALRAWWLDGETSGNWDASRLLSRTYPKFEAPLPETLMAMIVDADSDELGFVTSSLNGFKGRAALMPVLRAILASGAATDEIERVVAQVFNETGIMQGQYGAAQTYQAKADLLKPWLDDPSERVARFAEKKIQSLNRRVALETRWATEEDALRRLEYDEPIDGTVEGNTDTDSDD